MRFVGGGGEEGKHEAGKVATTSGRVRTSEQSSSLGPEEY